MRLTKLFAALALCVPFTFAAIGCGEEKAGQMATDNELAEYGEKSAKGTALEGVKMGGGAAKTEE